MKAIIIARVSTQDQKEANNSLPAQIVRLEGYCKEKGYEIVKSCSFDESAYTEDRYKFDDIVNFILKQKEKIIVCFDKVDRLSRNVFDRRNAQLYEHALNNKIELHFTSENQKITSRISAIEKYHFTSSLGMAKYYSDAISDTVKRAQEAKVRKGEWLSKAPYGYKNIKISEKKTDIIVDEYKADIIRTVFNLYATGAYSTELLSKKLQEDFNIKWPKGYIAKILNNPFYHGVMIINGQSHPHRYPPLITKLQFDEVQQIKSGFKKKPFKYAGLNYMYRGLFRCATCSCAITPEKHKGYVYYHCTQYNGKHGAKWLREEEITTQINNLLERLKLPDKIVQRINDALNELHSHKVEFQTKVFDELAREHKMVTKMTDNLYLDKLKGRISEEQYDRLYADFKDQVETINLKLARLQEAEDNYYLTSKYILGIVNKAHDLFKSSEVEEKRQILKLLLSNLRIDGENVLYDVQKPYNVILDYSDRQLWRG